MINHPGKKKEIGVKSLNSTEFKEIRKFGFIAFLFFGCLFALGVWRDKSVPMYLFGFLSFVGLGFVLFPSQLRPLYIFWNRTASFLGRILTTSILTLTYYLVMTPFAMIKRLFGGRPLPIKPDKEASSYWVTRIEPVQPSERFVKRY
jgi:hypothetical protein